MGKKIIGIDLGTTNSAIAIYDGTTGKILENLEGKRTTPSIIAFSKDGEVLVGEAAKRQAVTNPANTLYAVKRLIGRRFDDADVQKMAKTAPFKIVAADNGDAWVEVNGKKMAPAEISAKVLQKLKEAAESYLGESVTEAVITVPAYFNDSQRKATIDAGRIAGLDVKRIINEPTAAALAYGMKDRKDQTVIVYDLGGGTFDVSVLEIGEEGMIEVKATNGDTFLGGEDFDDRIINYLADEFKKTEDVDLRENQMSLQRLKEAAETAKKELSTAQTTQVNLPFIGVKDNQPLNLMIDLTRAKLESLVQDLVEKSAGPCKQALKDAGIDMKDIDEVLLVGGMTRMPMVSEFVQKTFGKAPNKSVNPDEVVASGASAQGAIISGEVNDVLLVDVTPLNFSIKTLGDVADIVIEANTAIPTKITKTYSNAEDNQNAVTVEIGQGNRELFSGNKSLGKFNLEGLPPAPRGTLEVEVTYQIDANGVLTVSAEEKTTGKKQSIRIEANGGLTETEIEQMRKDADANKEADAKRRAEVELKNKADTMVSDLRNIKNEDYYKGASEEARTAFNTASENLKTAVENNQNDNLQSLVEAVDKAKSGLGASFAEAQQNKAAATANDDNSDAPAAEQKPQKGAPPAP